VGQEARLALVRHALGLEGATEINSTADELTPNDTQLLGNTSSEPPTLDPDLPVDELDSPSAEKE
jgi:hypothetical protein